MKDILEFIQSISDSLKTRLKNPIFGTFIITWILFNWKGLLYLTMSKDSIENRIFYFSNCYTCPFLSFIFPLIFTFIYILGFPRFLLEMDKKTQKSIRDRKEFLNNERIEDLKLKEKYAEEENLLLDIKQKINLKNDEILTIESKDNQIEIRDKAIEDLKEKLKEKESELSKQIIKPTPLPQNKDVDKELEKLYNEGYDLAKNTIIKYIKKERPEINEIGKLNDYKISELTAICRSYNLSLPISMTIFIFSNNIPQINSEEYEKIGFKNELDKTIKNLNEFMEKINL